MRMRYVYQQRVKMKKRWLKTKKANKETSTSKRKKVNKAEEEENYSNSEDEEELKKVPKGKMEKGHKKPSKNLQDLDKRTENDHFIAEWEAQYSHIGKPTPREIALQLS
ncbi:hypothetical protein Tco_0164916, partial [Tanacetum coccineum]